MTRTDCEKQFVLDVANRFAINDESNCNPIADQEHLSPEDANWRNVRKRVERINFNLHQNRSDLTPSYPYASCVQSLQNVTRS